MAEKKNIDEGLMRVGSLLEMKRKALGKQYMSRERFISNRSEELFACDDWISLRHLHNIEKGRNWISIEKLIVLAKALEEDPVDLFGEILKAYYNN